MRPGDAVGPVWPYARGGATANAAIPNSMLRRETRATCPSNLFFKSTAPVRSRRRQEQGSAEKLGVVPRADQFVSNQAQSTPAWKSRGDTPKCFLKLCENTEWLA